MKINYFLFYCFFRFLEQLIAKNFEKVLDNSKINLEFSAAIVVDTIKKNNKVSKTEKSLAIIPPPQTTVKRMSGTG
jgi:hypothetical protein